MKRIFALLLTGGVIFSTGCPRYETVRRLSSEQLEVQRGFQANLNQYLTSMEQFADNQLIMAGLYLDDLANEQKRVTQQRMRNQINALGANDSSSRDALNQELGRAIHTIDVDNGNDKQELAALVQNLKSKHREIREAHAAILEAQAQLNEYIQLKKADEVLVQQLLGKINVNKQRIAGLFDDAASLLNRIRIHPPQPAPET